MEGRHRRVIDEKEEEEEEEEDESFNGIWSAFFKSFKFHK